MYPLNSINGIVISSSFVNSISYTDGLWLVYGELSGQKYFWAATRDSGGKLVTNNYIYDIYIYYI